MKSISVLLLTFIVLQSSAQSIVDYSHAESIEKTKIIESTTYDININPTEINEQYLQFPLACHLNHKLDSNQLSEIKSLQQINIQEHLRGLKANMTYFLRLSEQIKKNKLYLIELSSSQASNAEEKTLDEQKLDQLKDIESDLLRMNTTITDKIAELSELISQQINRTKRNSFDEIQLKFQLNAYQSKLKYLQNLKKGKVDRKDGSVNEKQIGQFFKDIDFELDREDKYLTNLNDLLQNYAENAQFKLKISNLQNQIVALNILIEEKEECLSKKDQLSLHQNHHQIEAIITKLRELKQLESSNRHYCEGVAIKLLNQLKKILKTYNYSFSCAEGLNKLKEKRTVVAIMLKAAHIQRDRLQYDNSSKRIQQFFNDSHSNKEQKIKQIKQFTIYDYDLNKDVIDNSIDETRQKLRDIQYRLQHPPEGEVKPMDYEKIREKVQQINDLQFEYCQHKYIYEDKYRKLDILVKGMQEQSKLNIQKRKLYINKVNQLRELQREFNQLRLKLVQALA